MECVIENENKLGEICVKEALADAFAEPLTDKCSVALKQLCAVNKIPEDSFAALGMLDCLADKQDKGKDTSIAECELDDRVSRHHRRRRRSCMDSNMPDMPDRKQRRRHQRHRRDRGRYDDDDDEDDSDYDDDEDDDGFYDYDYDGRGRRRGRGRRQNWDNGLIGFGILATAVAGVNCYRYYKRQQAAKNAELDSKRHTLLGGDPEQSEVYKA